MVEETKKKERKEEKSLEKMTVKELRAIAMEMPRSIAVHDMKKDELVALIKEARGIKDETPVKKRKHLAKIKMTKPELKARISELKVMKLQALESNDNNNVVMLRHQISQLKKKSRRFAAA